MAITISNTVTPSEESPHLRKAFRKALRQHALREKLLRHASAHLRILQEHQRSQQLTTLYDPTMAQRIRGGTLQAQAAPTQALLSLDTLGRETTQVLRPVDLHRFLTPMDLDWVYKATQERLLRELQYDPIQSLIRDLSHWEAVQRQLIGPWFLVGPWRRAKTMHWLLWALQEGDTDDKEAALAELATMIRRPRLSREAGFQLQYRARFMRMSSDDYWRRVVLPQAFLLVWGASTVPRRIQLGGNGQGRVLDAQGRWTPQVPEDTLSTELLASYLFDEIPKAAACILTDQDYPIPSHDLWHARPIEKKDDQGIIERIPRVVRLQPGERDVPRRPGHICEPSPEAMAISKLDLQKLWIYASPRQRQILELLLKGYRASEIASDLHITSQAVHEHLKRLYQKYQAG